MHAQPPFASPDPPTPTGQPFNLLLQTRAHRPAYPCPVKLVCEVFGSGGLKGDCTCIGVELNYSNTSQTSLTGHGRARIGRAVGAEGSEGAKRGWAYIRIELNYLNNAQTS